jgi:hypothetical protein
MSSGCNRCCFVLLLAHCIVEVCFHWFGWSLNRSICFVFIMLVLCLLIVCIQILFCILPVVFVLGLLKKYCQYCADVPPLLVCKCTWHRDWFLFYFLSVVFLLELLKKILPILCWCTSFVILCVHVALWPILILLHVSSILLVTVESYTFDIALMYLLCYSVCARGIVTNSYFASCR